MKRALRPLLSRAAHSAEILWQLSLAELKARYFQKSLSYFWLVLEPLLLAFTFFFLTLVLSGRRGGPGGPDYAEIFMGVVLWNWFRGTANAGMVSMLASAGILKQIRFPPVLLFLARMLTETIAFTFSLALVLGVLVAFGKPVTVFWLEMPFGLLAQWILSLALAVWLSMLGVFLRDSLSLVNFTLNLALYVSPVVYRAELVPTAYRWVLDWNPFTSLMRAYRNTLVDGRPIDNWAGLLAWTLGSALFLAAGLWTLERSKRKFYRFL
jgi:lipopolysaccharide transport system permease protein